MILRRLDKQLISEPTPLVVERLEERLNLNGGGTLFDVIDPKYSDAYDDFESEISLLYTPAAAADLRATFVDAYDDASSSGAMSNQLSGQGATLFTAHQDYIGEWYSSEPMQHTTTIPTYTEQTLKNLGDLTKGAFNEAISDPSLRFEIGAAAVCWGVGLTVFPVVTPWCTALTAEVARSFTTDFAVEFFTEAGHQAVDNLDWSATTKANAHEFLDLAEAGYDILGWRKDLLDSQRILEAPDIFARVYHTTEAAANFSSFVNDMKEQQEDLFRSSDPATVGFVSASLQGSAIKFQSQQVGNAVLDILSSRPLNQGEKDFAATILGDDYINTQFYEFTGQESQQIIQAIGAAPDPVRVQDGQIIVFGTDSADNIDVYSATDVTGDIEVTVNSWPTRIFTRAEVPNGVAIYARGGNDTISVRTDFSSSVSGGAGHDTITGGWGPDFIKGGPGNDLILGRQGDDVLRGDYGDDEVRGGSGNNTLSGGPGNNTVIDNHQLISFEVVVDALELAPNPNGNLPILPNVSATPSVVSTNESFEISAIGADGNGGSISHMEVWEWGQGGQMLGADYLEFDGFSVTIDAAVFGGTGIFKTITRLIGSNDVASNWVAKDIEVTEPSSDPPELTNFVLTPNPARIGDDVTMTVFVDDPLNALDAVQYIWDVDGSETYTSGDEILGNGSKQGNVWVFNETITENYDIGVERFVARGLYNNSTWTAPIARALQVDPPPNSAPYIGALTASDERLIRGLTLTLTAHGITGPLPITEVRFYWDSNGSGTLESNGGQNDDEYLGSDTNGSNGWKKVLSTAPFPLGDVRFFAQPEDGIQKGNFKHVDVELLPPDTEDPAATVNPLANVTEFGGIEYGFSVVYTDNYVISVSSIDDNDIRVTGPNGFSVFGELVNVDHPENGTPRVATYKFTAPGGIWDFLDNGTYTVHMEHQEVRDIGGQYVPSGVLGTFDVNVADSTPPLVDIVGLSIDVTQPSTFYDPDLVVNATADDPESGVVADQYYFYLQEFRNGIWQPPVEYGPGQPSVSLTSLDAGLYSIYATAENGAGLVGISDNAFFEISLVRMEYGTIADLTNSWQTISLAETYVDPVVIIGPLSVNGQQPAVTQVRNAGANGFEVRIKEWNYLDGTHIAESVGYLVIESGVHDLGNGTYLEAGTTNLNNVWTTVQLQQDFGIKPVVVSQLMSSLGRDTTTVRQRRVSNADFQFKLQEEEGNNGTHLHELVGYLAISQGTASYNGIGFEAGLTSNSVTEEDYAIGFAQAYAVPPAFLAAMQTYNGPDPAALRARSVSTSSASIFIQEEQSVDSEVDHKEEVVGYLAFGLGSGTPRSNDNDWGTGTDLVSTGLHLLTLESPSVAIERAEKAPVSLVPKDSEPTKSLSAHHSSRQTEALDWLFNSSKSDEKEPEGEPMTKDAVSVEQSLS